MQLELSALDEMIVIDNLPIFQLNGFEFEVDESKPTTQRVSLVAYPFTQNTEFGIAGTLPHLMFGCIIDSNLDGRCDGTCNVTQRQAWRSRSVVTS